ncbi:hypothetical protein RF11_08071 [Thelohanellus kitauei]|uniref:Uncharacterized protein n=1 Tax=Thelohanellus kitauei TaxID=669202 RepID=A0A0C2MB78_THEKT|nr:hypothetical protein RF11_08071 [Thelohanellus kitauei]
MSDVLCKIRQMLTKCSLVPVFVGCDVFNENFRNCLSRLEQHFTSCAVLDLGDTKAKLVSFLRAIRTNSLVKYALLSKKKCSYEEISKIQTDNSDEDVYFIHAGVECSRYSTKFEHSYKECVAKLRCIEKRCRF